MSMGSRLVLEDRRSLLLRLLRSYQMFDVVDERGTQAWCSPKVHILCLGVCKTELPGERGVCVFQAQQGNLALQGHFEELSHSQRQQGTVAEPKEEVAGIGAAAV